MAYSINDECISCGACAASCPSDAITEGESKYEVDAGKCVDCGACGDICPVSAAQAG